MRVYRDEAVGICLRLMTMDDTDLIVAWRNKEELYLSGIIYQGRA